MIVDKTWQKEYLLRISDVLKEYNDVQAVVIKGSCADDINEVDIWSDIDLVVIVSNESCDFYWEDMSWLNSLGQVFAYEKYPGGNIETLRVCLSNFVRFDFVFVKQSYISVDSTQYIFDRSNKILFSKLGYLDQLILESPKETSYTELASDEFNKIVNKFWFKGTLAISKIARGDYLIASHLAFEMAQETIVLQMMIRDIYKGTNVHRFGDCEQIDVISTFLELKKEGTLENILDIIEQSSITFDRLAKVYSEQQDKRMPTFRNMLQNLRRCLE